MNASNYMSIATSMQHRVDNDASPLEKSMNQTVNFGKAGGALSEPINFGLKDNGTGV